MLVYIHHEAVKQLRVSLRSVGPVHGGKRPIILCCPQGCKSALANMLVLPDGVSKGAHRMAQLSFQYCTALTNFILQLRQIGEACQGRMMHGMGIKRDPAALIHLAHFCPGEW